MALRLALGFGLGIFLPISIAIASILFKKNALDLNFLHLLLLLIFGTGLSSLLQYMICRKRTAGGVEDNDTSSYNTLKNPRFDCLRSSSSAEANGNPDSMDEKTPEIDEDLHSRQLAVYGRDTMRRLFKSNILVSGMQGLGVEIGMQLFIFSCEFELQLKFYTRKMKSLPKDMSI